MQVKFSLQALIITAVLFAILLLLATVGAGLGWIRSFLGDVIVVVFVYFALRTVIEANRHMLIFGAFLIGVAVELGQYLAKQWDITISNPVLRIVLGATPDWLDVLAYAIGALFLLCILQINRSASGS